MLKIRIYGGVLLISPTAKILFKHNENLGQLAAPQAVVDACSAASGKSDLAKPTVGTTSVLVCGEDSCVM